MLRDLGLEVHPPMPQRSHGKFWVQLRGGPFDLAHNLPILKRLSEELKSLMAMGQVGETSPAITKLDSTRDLRGTLYVLGDCKSKHRELAQALE